MRETACASEVIMKFENKGVQKFIDESIALCTPDKVVLIDGSE